MYIMNTHPERQTINTELGAWRIHYGFMKKMQDLLKVKWNVITEISTDNTEKP